VATSIATAYVDIMPSTRGLRAALEKDLAPAAKSAGTSAGRVLGDAVADETQRIATPRLNKVMADVATKGKAGFRDKIRGIGASLVDEFKATGGIRQTLTVLGRDLDVSGSKLRGFASNFRTVATSSSGLSAGLGGVSSLLGGPWGLAIAGAGLAVNGFIQAQANAKAAIDELTASVDAQTGAFTLKSIQSITAQIVKDLDKPGDLGLLKSLGVNLKDATTALFQGGTARDSYTAKLRAQYDASQGQSTASLRQRAALKGLINSLENQDEVLGSTRTQLGLNKEATDAAAGAARALGIDTSDAASKARDLGNAVRGIPTGWSVVVTTNLAEVVNLAVAAARALAAVAGAGAQYSAGSALNNYAAGIRSGDIADPIAAAQAKAAKAAKEAARKAAAAARSARSGSRSGGGGGSRTAAANPLIAARSALAASVAGSFAQDLIKNDAAGIARATKAEIGLVRKALTGKAESSLVALLKRDNVRLLALTTARKGIAARLATAESDLSNMRQAKASTIESVTSSAMGDLTDARSASGIKRILTKQLANVKTFRSNLATLVKRGLPTVFLDQLIRAGLDGAATAAALVRSNDSDFSTIKSLTNELAGESKKLGVESGSILYDTGIQTMQGLIAGLKSQDKALEAQMLTIAKSMQAAIRKALGIKSPSKVFEGLGMYVGAGFAQGVDKSSSTVNRSVAGMVNIPRATAYAPAFNRSGANVPVVGSINVHAAANVSETAAAVAGELMWRARR